MNNKNRIEQQFTTLKSAQKTVFIAFITAGDIKIGDPLKETVKIMQGLVRGGADIIELGVPFSDPSADGPTIQQSNERALTHNISINNVLQIVELFRISDDITPVILMGYINPIENLGYKTFINLAKKAGIDGLITVDLPPEESTELEELLNNAGINPIYLIAPTSTKKRIQTIAQHAKGFIYCVSVKGVTGQKSPNFDSVTTQIKLIRQFTNLPIAIGFGIKDKKSIQNASKCADAVVIGSAIIDIIQKSTNSADIVVQNFIKQLKS